MKQTTSPSKIIKFAEQHGVELTIDKVGNTYHIDCWAPKGVVWSESQTHFRSLHGDGFYYDPPNWKETMDDLKQNVAAGFEKCEQDECDICLDEAEEEARNQKEKN